MSRTSDAPRQPGAILAEPSIATPSSVRSAPTSCARVAPVGVRHPPDSSAERIELQAAVVVVQEQIVLPPFRPLARGDGRESKLRAENVVREYLALQNFPEPHEVTGEKIVADVRAV